MRLGLFIACATGAVVVQSTMAIAATNAQYLGNMAVHLRDMGQAIVGDTLFVGPVLAAQARYDKFK